MTNAKQCIEILTDMYAEQGIERVINKDALKHLRKSLDLTQADMAEKLGLKREQYNRVENGKANLSAASEKLAQNLLESVSTLISGVSH